MSLQYLDKSLLPITPQEWGGLIRKPTYTIVLRHRSSASIVETSWLGVGASNERPAKVFVVRQFKLVANEDPERPPKQLPKGESWHATEKEAVAAHRALARELGIRVDVGRAK